jgi:hypothetical protein
MNTNNNVLIGGLVVLVLLFAGWWTTTRPVGEGVATSTAATSTSASATTSTVATGGLNPSMVGTGEAVTVRDQAAGDSVAVTSVTLMQQGWVAIRDDSGRVLGAALFNVGTWGNVSVPLLRATSASSSYQVLLYADDGDKQFDLHKDILITGSNGGVAGTTFKTF